MERFEAELKEAAHRERGFKGFIKGNLLIILTLVGVLAGGTMGFILKSSNGHWTARDIMYINFLGDLFLRMLKALILPLIVSSLVSAIANLDLSLSGKIARRAVLYYSTTTFLAVVLGIILVVTIQPGYHTSSHRNSTSIKTPKMRNVTTPDTLLDLVRSMFPPNLLEACVTQYRTALTPPADNPNAPIRDWNISFEAVSGMNILGLVVFAAVLGITLAKIGEAGRPLTNLFQSLMTATMTITTGVIWLSPIGIFFLVAAKIMEMENFGDTMSQLGLYFGTVVLGLFIQGFIFLPLVYFVVTRHNPFRYIANLAQALTTAFGTGSSSATLPITIRCIEEISGVDPRIARFALPIGATINMDGTALYEAVAAIFIAQVRGVDLSLGHIIAISITATAASIGAAGIPQAGLVTMVMVLDTVGLPAEDVTLILAVDWLLDRFRTTINVLGDAFGAGLVHLLSTEELKQLDAKQKLVEEHNELSKPLTIEDHHV